MKTLTENIDYREDDGSFIIHYVDIPTSWDEYGESDNEQDIDYIVSFEDMDYVATKMLGISFYGEKGDFNEELIVSVFAENKKFGNLVYGWFMDNAIEYANENARAYEMDRGII